MVTENESQNQGTTSSSREILLNKKQIASITTEVSPTTTRITYEILDFNTNRQFQSYSYIDKRGITQKAIHFDVGDGAFKICLKLPEQTYFQYTADYQVDFLWSICLEPEEDLDEDEAYYVAL